MLATVVQRARSNPDGIAISSDEVCWTNVELMNRAHEWRQFFAGHRSKRGQLVAVLALNGGPEHTACLLGAWACGVVIAPVSAQAKARELAECMLLGDADCLIAEMHSTSPGWQVATVTAPGALVFWRKPPPERTDSFHSGAGPDSLWQLQFTSGTTGRPRCVEIQRRAWLANIQESAAFVRSHRFRAVFCPLPQFHGMCGALVFEYLMHGCAVHLSNAFEPDSHAARLVSHQVDAVATNASYLRLASQFIDFPKCDHLKHMVLGAEPVDRGLLDQIWCEGRHLTIHIRYGVTESVGALCRLSLSYPAHGYTSGDVGSPTDNVELRISGKGPGDIEVRSRAAALSIIENGARTRLVDGAGWFATGDVGEITAASRPQLRLVARRGWLVKRMGHRINPCEVEEVLRHHPAVHEAAVIPVEDSSGQTDLIAFVTTRQTECTVQELRQHCLRELSTWKVPQEIWVRDALPRTMSGKLDRYELIQGLEARSAGGAIMKFECARDQLGGLPIRNGSQDDDSNRSLAGATPQWGEGTK